MTENARTRYYQKRDDGAVQCGLCPQACVIKPGQRGVCGVRQNQAGDLVALNYGLAIATHADPIEKKPLFHVLPGSVSYSVATVGCNLRCSHCQNHDISQYPRRTKQIPGRFASPDQVVAGAREARAKTISFTYSEPTIFMEWAQDIAHAAQPAGIRCVSVTNGFVSAQPIRDLAPVLLAANVDLKAFDDHFYRHTCGGRLQPVLDTISLLRELGVWVEVTTLLIPGLNDNPKQLNELARFLVSVDPAMPWHLSRFHPDNEMHDRPPTSTDIIHRARSIGREAGLRFVYSGNVWGDAGEHTLCPDCQTGLIERHGFTVHGNRIESGACRDCGERIEGVWN